MAPNHPSHFVLISQPALGHSRPLLALGLNLLSRYPALHITFLAYSSFFSKLPNEIAVFDLAPEVRNRLTLVGVQEEQSGALVENANGGGVEKALKEVWGAAQGGAGVRDEITASEIEGIKIVPSLTIVDMFQTNIPNLLTTLQTTYPHLPKPPYLMFFPGPAVSLIEHFGPEEMGGKSIGMTGRKDALLKAAGGEGREMTEDQAWIQAYLRNEGKLYEYPGAPPLYDYEMCPQSGSFPLPPHIIPLFPLIQQNYLASSGAVLTSSHALEGSAPVEAARGMWPGGGGKEVLLVGPQFARGVWEGTGRGGEGDEEVMRFLDEAGGKWGKKSVVYLSFGSIWWPLLRPSLLTHLIHSLLASHTPFVFATCSPMGGLSDELVEEIRESGLGFVTMFAPQMRVLGHTSVGWFLTHCGSNSTHESILHSIPTLTLPFGADQPLISALLTSHNAGIELYQLRSGICEGKMTGGGVMVEGTEEAMVRELEGVWKDVRGEKGEEVRSGMGRLSEGMRKEAGEGGRDWEAVRGLEKWM